jgi:hypothetical protein
MAVPPMARGQFVVLPVDLVHLVLRAVQGAVVPRE